MAIKHFAFAALLVVASAASTLAADADPLADFSIPGVKNPKPDDFAFGGLKDLYKNLSPGDNNIIVRTAFAADFPALNTQGIGFALLKLGSNASVPSHTHPRATEIIFVIKGTLKVSFVDTTLKAFTKVLRAGDVSVFPRGLLHGQKNIGDGEALFLAALNSQNPGTQFQAPALAALFS